jgi:AraC family transcriptional regulator, regulatory protein of adaptative response / methylated-DNA-[protein]-cysteine methyltransferase
MNKAAELKALAAATTSDPRWDLLVEKEKAGNRDFFYSVRTTGVYCRPSCGARLPRPENVRFYATTSEAASAGFRPCKRCKPDRQPRAAEHAAIIVKVCRLIEATEKLPNLQEVAQVAGMSVFHLHRTFKAVTGLTPGAYAAARRTMRVRKSLSTSPSVTDAIYHAGFNSSSRFYETSNESLGMTPTTFRDGGADTGIHFAIAQCSLGSILVAKSERGVCAVLLGDDPAQLVIDLQNQFPKAKLLGNEGGYEDLVAKIVRLVEQPAVGVDLPLDIRGTVFQQRVWKALQTIPLGSTASYAEIAAAIGTPKAIRAVAQACAANTLAALIPCHRVIRTDGGLAGYRWGVQRKRKLLEREATV